METLWQETPALGELKEVEVGGDVPIWRADILRGCQADSVDLKVSGNPVRANFVPASAFIAEKGSDHVSPALQAQVGLVGTVHRGGKVAVSAGPTQDLVEVDAIANAWSFHVAKGAAELQEVALILPDDQTSDLEVGTWLEEQARLDHEIAWRDWS